MRAHVVAKTRLETQRAASGPAERRRQNTAKEASSSQRSKESRPLRGLISTGNRRCSLNGVDKNALYGLRESLAVGIDDMGAYGGHHAYSKNPRSSRETAASCLLLMFGLQACRGDVAGLFVLALGNGSPSEPAPSRRAVFPRPLGDQLRGLEGRCREVNEICVRRR